MAGGLIEMVSERGVGATILVAALLAGCVSQSVPEPSTAGSPTPLQAPTPVVTVLGIETPEPEPTASPTASFPAYTGAIDTGLDGITGVATWADGRMLLGGVTPTPAPNGGTIPPGIRSEAVARLDGSSWSRSILPAIPPSGGRTQVVGVAAPVDGSPDAWALARCALIFGVVAGCFGTVLHSTNGGATWTRQETRDGLTHLSFADGKHGWALATEVPADLAGIYATDDAGASWHRVGWPCPGDFDLKGIARVSATTGWAACTGEAATIMEARAIRRTDDAGKTWRTVALNDPSSGTQIGSVGASGHLTGLAALPDGQLWSWADRGTLEHSLDGGVTWSALPLGEPDVATVTDASFGDAEHGAAIVFDGGDARAIELERTDDGGQSWTIVEAWPIDQP